MTIVSSNPSVKPTALEVVNRVLRECGIPEVSNLSPGNPNSKLALEALNDCVWDIHSRVLWPWCKSKYTVNLVANQADYLMPADFRAMSLEPRLWVLATSKLGAPFIEYSPEEWTDHVPFTTSNVGAPNRFKIQSLTMTVDPVPSSDTIALYPQMQFEYFRWPAKRLTLSDGNGSFDVPLELTKALVTYGRAELKRFAEYPDWDSEMKIYEEAVKKQLEAAKQIRKPYQLRPKYPSRWNI